MNIFRITDNNTKRILRGEDIPKNTLPITVDLSEDEKLKKEEKKSNWDK